MASILHRHQPTTVGASVGILGGGGGITTTNLGAALSHRRGTTTAASSIVPSFISTRPFYKKVRKVTKVQWIVCTLSFLLLLRTISWRRDVNWKNRNNDINPYYQQSQPWFASRFRRAKTPYEIFQERIPVDRTSDILGDAYVTLWLHQVHTWFGSENDQRRYDNIEAWLVKVKNQGFGAVMGDIPWSWTERERKGEILLDTWNKDWMGIACRMGLKLHIVLNMMELPPWIDTVNGEHHDYVEKASTGTNCEKAALPENQLHSPSSAHPEVWQLLQSFVRNATSMLLEKYGSECIATISPTLNNEFETRYAQTVEAMRDYSDAAQQEYKKWLQYKDGVDVHEASTATAPAMPCGPICHPIKDDTMHQWLGFREEFLADRYIEMCHIIRQTTYGGNKGRPIKCLLHIGEMFATTDHLNSNLFFRLASSPYVDDLVMDSNMMLSGAPTSPSVVGLLVSTAKIFQDKRIHYEVATERALPCDGQGNLLQPPAADTRGKNKGKSLYDIHDLGANLLLRTGVLHALESGVHSIGVTNLCAPENVDSVLPMAPQTDPNTMKALHAAPSFEPTALIYIPYRSFYSFSRVISGYNCYKRPIECWHPSFHHLELFGSLSQQEGGSCPIDVAQHTLLQVWDDLRTRHAHVAVIGEASMLASPSLSRVTERKFVRFPCVLQRDKWHIYNGQQEKQMFEEFSRAHRIDQVIAQEIC